MRFLVFILFPVSLFSQDRMFRIRQQQTILYTSMGESNEPGYGQNYFLSSLEKAPRRTRMFDISTEKFDRLRIGSANNLGSFDTTHGFEAQLANALDSGYFSEYNLYITKTGQGSTRVHDWMPGSILLNRMIDRVDKSLILIDTERNVVPIQFMLISLGINDMFASLSAANFKDSIDIILDELHGLYPSMKFIFTKFNQGAYTGYNTTYDAIATERSSYVFTVYDASAGLRADNTHWDYLGLKSLGRLITEIIQDNL